MPMSVPLPRYIWYADLSNLTGVFLEVSRVVLGLLAISWVQVPCVWPPEVSCCSCATFFQYSLRKMRSPWLWEQANIHLQLSHLPADAALDSPAGLEAQPHQKKPLKYSCDWFDTKGKKRAAYIHTMQVDKPLACLVLHVWQCRIYPLPAEEGSYLGAKKH